MLRLAFCMIILCLPPLGDAAHAQPMVFVRENVDIVSTRKPQPQKSKKAKSAAEKKKGSKTGKRSASGESIVTHHVFSTEIYPMSATNIDWFSNRTALEKGRGIMIVLENRDELSLGWSNTTTPYDVLFVQGNGKIQIIVPDLVLGELTDPLEITGRIKAVLYLRAGTAKELDILPGDRVEHGLFKPSPLILQ